MANGFSSSEAAWSVVLTTHFDDVTPEHRQEIADAVKSDAAEFNELRAALPVSLTEDLDRLHGAATDVGAVLDDQWMDSVIALAGYSAQTCGLA